MIPFWVQFTYMIVVVTYAAIMVLPQLWKKSEEN